MLTPSYSELMDKMNRDKLVDSKITSRYTIVLAVAKRARQIIDGAEPLSYAPSDRAVSIAVKEMGEGKIKIDMEENLLDGSYERLVTAQNKYKNITAATSDDLRENLKEDYSPSIYTTDDDEMQDEDFKDGYAEEASVESYLYDEKTGDLKKYDDSDE